MKAKFFLDGVTNTLSVFDDKVVITDKKIKKRFFFMWNKNKGKGKTIYIKNIKSMELRKPNAMVNGFLQFNLDGSSNLQIDTMSENAFNFRGNDTYEKCVEVRDFIEKLISSGKQEYNFQKINNMEEQKIKKEMEIISNLFSRDEQVVVGWKDGDSTTQIVCGALDLEEAKSKINSLSIDSLKEKVSRRNVKFIAPDENFVIYPKSEYVQRLYAEQKYLPTMIEGNLFFYYMVVSSEELFSKNPVVLFDGMEDDVAEAINSMEDAEHPIAVMPAIMYAQLFTPYIILDMNAIIHREICADMSPIVSAYIYDYSEALRERDELNLATGRRYGIFRYEEAYNLLSAIVDNTDAFFSQIEDVSQ